MKQAYNPLNNLSLETKIHLQGFAVREAESNLKAGALLYPNHVEGWQRGLKYEQDKLAELLGYNEPHGTLEN